MIIVADTSPINYLILIKEIDILPQIYGTVLVPRAVLDELLRASAPEIVRNWCGQLPGWFEVKIPQPGKVEKSLFRLDAGERDAIALAQELRANRLIIDDREGRREAEKLGIPVLGTLGVLREAYALGLLDLRTAVNRLQTTSFYVAPEVLKQL